MLDDSYRIQRCCNSCKHKVFFGFGVYCNFDGIAQDRLDEYLFDVDADDFKVARKWLDDHSIFGWGICDRYQKNIIPVINEDDVIYVDTNDDLGE